MVAATASVAPAVTSTSESGSLSRPQNRFPCSAIAARSAGMPGPGGYWFSPLRSAVTAAASISGGPSVSGKPWPRFTAPVRTASADISAKTVVPNGRMRWTSGSVIPGSQYRNLTQVTARNEPLTVRLATSAPSTVVRQVSSPMSVPVLRNASTDSTIELVPVNFLRHGRSTSFSRFDGPSSSTYETSTGPSPVTSYTTVTGGPVGSTPPRPNVGRSVGNTGSVIGSAISAALSAAAFTSSTPAVAVPPQSSRAMTMTSATSGPLRRRGGVACGG